MNKQRVLRAGSCVLVLGGIAFAGCGDDASDPPAAAGKGGSGGGSAGKGGAAGSSAGKGGLGGSSAGKGGSAGSSSAGEATGGAGGEMTGGAAGEPSQGGAAGDAGGAGAGGQATEAGAGGGGGEAGESSVLRCGSAPYARANLGGTVLLDHPTGPISVEASSCPATDITIEHPTVASTQGTPVLVDLPSLTPLYFKATQTGSYPSLGAEFVLDADSILYNFFDALPANVLMAASDIDFTALVPAWTATTHAVVYVLTAKADGGTAGCADVGGITYTVMGHAETVAKYSGNGSSTQSGGGGGSATLIITTTGTLAAPEMVTIVGTKAGCSVKTTAFVASGGTSSQTGKVPVAVGATSGFVTAAIGNL